MTYEFYCDPEEGGCGHQMEIQCRFADKAKNTPKSCKKCRKRKSIREMYGGGSSTFVPKTLGHHVDKQSARMSADEKHHIHTKNNDYRDKSTEPNWVSTPDGMVHTGKDR